jgi:hypothetical protein
MNIAIIKSTLQGVQEDLAQVDAELERLNARRGTLQAVVASLSKYLEESGAFPELKPKFEVTGLLFDQRPKWMLVRDVLPKDGSTLTVPEIHKLVNAKGLVIKNPDAIRVIMRRKTDIFENRGGARFALKSGHVRYAQEDAQVAS